MAAGGEKGAVRLAFDRGTIVIEGDGAARIASHKLPGAVWDDRVGAWRAPAREHGDLRRAAMAELGAAVRDEVRADDPPPARWALPPLRPYQQAALCAWELAGRRGIVVLPTGSGKTRVALGAMARAGLRVLCLVPTRVLLDQWRAEIGKFYGGAVGVYGDGARELAAVTVATFESAWRHMAALGRFFDLLVVDECHHFGSGLRDEALEMSIAGARLGLTATPPKEGDAAGLRRLIGPTVYELGIGDLAGSFLANFDVLVLRLDLAPEERRAYEADMARLRAALGRWRALVPAGSWGDFARAAMRSPEGREAIAGWRRVRKLLAYPRAKAETVRLLLERHRDGRVLVFTADNETAYEISRRHLIMPITCDIERREREAALERYRRGELRALVSARVLNEGFDVPDAEVAIVVGGALGEREHVQRVGRLLRPAPGKRALVYELVSRATIEVKHAKRRHAGLAARVAPAL